VRDHARNFSELMQGAQALYNLLLARRASQELGQDHEKLIEDLLGELESWAEVIADHRAELQTWAASEDFWDVVERVTKVPVPTRRFVLAWATVALDRPEVIPTDAEAALLVTERERQLKGKLARLSEIRALENWKGEPFSRGQLTFRWPTARRMLDDLADHEEA
jgi:hypothetical protein